MNLKSNDADMKRAQCPDTARNHRTFINAALLALAFFADPPVAKAHDIYSGLYSNYGRRVATISIAYQRPTG